jgi:hypothetical protein
VKRILINNSGQSLDDHYFPLFDSILETNELDVDFSVIFEVNDMILFHEWLKVSDISGKIFTGVLGEQLYEWGKVKFAYPLTHRLLWSMKRLAYFIWSSLLTLIFRGLSCKCHGQRIIVVPSKKTSIKYHGFLPFLSGLFRSNHDPVDWTKIARDIDLRSEHKLFIMQFPVFLCPYIQFGEIKCQEVLIPHLSKTDILWPSGCETFYNQELLLDVYGMSRYGWGRLTENNGYDSPSLLKKKLQNDTKYNSNVERKTSDRHDEIGRKIIFLAQMPQDKSISQNYVCDYYKSFELFKKMSADLKLDAYVKLHPLLNGNARKEMIDLIDMFEMKTIDGGIKNIIRTYQNFATVSSGSGVEVLVANKQLYVFGCAGYSKATTQVIEKEGVLKYLNPICSIDDYLSKFRVI